MKKRLKLIAAALAAVTAMSLTSVTAFADSIKTIDGIKYRYSDSGEQKGKYTGWARAKNGDRYYYKDGVMLKSRWITVGGKRTYFLRSNGKMAVGDIRIGGTYYCFGADGKMIYGIQAMNASDFCESGMTVILRGVVLNDPKTDITGGEHYHLERRTDSGKWVKVPTIIDEYGFNDIGYPFFDDDGKPCEHTLNLNWEWLYGKLPLGVYRLCSSYIVKYDKYDTTTRYESKTLYSTFRISDNNSNVGDYDVNFEITKQSRTGISFKAVRSGNYKGGLSWDFDCYDIEKKNEAGEWELYKGKSFMGAVTCESWDISYEGFTPFELSWGDSDSGRYGKLTDGDYRVHLIFNDGARRSKDFYVEFTIK